ncbi:MAG: Wzz/FepE/Etk N-terminal domain-containing protein [Mariprofundales bacterium]
MTSSQNNTHRSEGEADTPSLPPVDPRLLAAMYGQQPYEEDEIDLLEYWNLIWRRKITILTISLLAALVAVVISLQMPNIYRAEVLLAPVGSDGKGGGISAALGGLGGLASMAGISLGGGGSSTEVNLAVLKSREFIWNFVKENKLMPLLFADDWDTGAKKWIESDPTKQPTLWDAYRALTAIMGISSDKKTGLITVSVQGEDPDLAAQWANALVHRLNSYLRSKAIARSKANLSYLHQELDRTRVADMRQTLFELISQEQKKAMLANTQEQFAFRVVDAASPPDKKTKPKRSLIVILATFVAGFLAIIAVFIQEGVKNRRQEMAKGLDPT